MAQGNAAARFKARLPDAMPGTEPPADRLVSGHEIAPLEYRSWRRVAVGTGDVDVLRRRRLVFALLLLAHVAFYWHLDRAMELRPRAVAAKPAIADEDVLIVEFIAPEPVVPPIPDEPIEGPVQRAVDNVSIPQLPERKREEEALSARFIAPEPEPGPAKRIDLYNRDGSLRLSPDIKAIAEPTRAYRQFRGETLSESLQRHDTVPYDATRFEKSWAPPNESLAQELVRKAIVEKTVKTPWGTKMRCAALVIPLFGACAFGIPDTPLANPPRAPEPSNPIPPPPDG
jgi:hypothetical protein